VYLAVNYKADMIESRVGDGSNSSNGAWAAIAGVGVPTYLLIEGQ